LTQLAITGFWNVTTIELNAFQDLPNLEKLCLTNNFIKRIELGAFNYLNKLKRLGLNWNSLTGSCLNEISMLSCLEFLSLANNQIYGSLVIPSNNCRLKALNLSGNNLLCVPERSVSNLPLSLVNLNLMLNQVVIESGAFEGLVNLRSLNLACNDEILNLNYIFNRDTINLSSLNLRGGKHVPILLHESEQTGQEEEYGYNKLALVLKLCLNRVLVFAQFPQVDGPHLLNTLNDDGLIDLEVIDYSGNTRQFY
jgi:Leucine-rich repeat (LRR) protein